MVVIRTLTRHKKRGNLRWYKPWGCVRLLRGGGVVNAVGLTNPGIEWWCNKIGPSIDFSEIPLVGSIFSDDVNGLAEMADMLNEFNLAGLEFNASCPNTEESLSNAKFIIEGCKMLSEASKFPIILKLSVTHDVEEIVSNVGRIVEAISINSVPWKIAFPDSQSPFAHLGGGGVSGKVAQKYTWRLVEKLVKITSIPVIGPSVWDYGDISKLRALGARAISFGSVFLRDPRRPTKFVHQDIKEEFEADRLLNNL